MTRGPLSFRKLNDVALLRLLNEQSNCDLTYSPLGITDQDHSVDGYDCVRNELEVGSGQLTFDRAVHNLQEWKVHQRVGMSITSQSPIVTENAVVLFQLRYLCLYVTIACRVVKIIRDEQRWGFAYGTLPHHPEQGEELFIVEHEANDSVCFKVRAHSRPGHVLARLGSPVARHVQKVITLRYLQAMKELVSEKS